MAFAIRATQKVLKRLGVTTPAEPGPPTTALGDWYVNLIYVERSQFVLCTSDKSLLSVVLEARRMKTELVPRLRDGVAEVLRALGVREERVSAELAQMSSPVVARTASKSVLGSMNDFAFLFSVGVQARPGAALTELSLELCRTPCQPLAAQYERPFPDHVARRLLAEA